MPDSGYCKLFVDTKLRHDELVRAIQEETNGSLDHGYVDCDWGSLYVNDNEEYSHSKTGGDDGFLYYKYFLEVNPSEDRGFDVYVEGLRKLISHLRMLPARTVAACDFEDLLKFDDPKNGIE